jgi:hypothetical protein
MARMDWEKARRRDRARRLESDYGTDPVIGSDAPRYVPPSARQCLSRWSDTPRRRIPPPPEPPARLNPRRLVLHWFNDDGSVGFTADGSGA